MEHKMYDPNKSEQWNIERGNRVIAYCPTCSWQATCERISTAESFGQLHFNLHGHSTRIR